MLELFRFIRKNWKGTPRWRIDRNYLWLMINRNYDLVRQEARSLGPIGKESNFWCSRDIAPNQILQSSSSPLNIPKFLARDVERRTWSAIQCSVYSPLWMRGGNGTSKYSQKEYIGIFYGNYPYRVPVPPTSCFRMVRHTIECLPILSVILLQYLLSFVRNFYENRLVYQLIDPYPDPSSGQVSCSKGSGRSLPEFKLS